MDNYEDEYDEQDIDGTVEALRAAWKCAPDASLGELIDSVTPMSFVEMTNAEIISSLNEFVIQNQK